MACGEFFIGWIRKYQTECVGILESLILPFNERRIYKWIFQEEAGQVMVQIRKVVIKHKSGLLLQFLHLLHPLSVIHALNGVIKGILCMFQLLIHFLSCFLSCLLCLYLLFDVCLLSGVVIKSLSFFKGDQSAFTRLL